VLCLSKDAIKQASVGTPVIADQKVTLQKLHQSLVRHADFSLEFQVHFEEHLVFAQMRSRPKMLA
jgi:hypothetical protein